MSCAFPRLWNASARSVGVFAFLAAKWPHWWPCVFLSSRHFPRLRGHWWGHWWGHWKKILDRGIVEPSVMVVSHLSIVIPLNFDGMPDPCRHDVSRVAFVQPFRFAACPHVLKQPWPRNDAGAMKDGHHARLFWSRELSFGPDPREHRRSRVISHWPGAL